MAVSWDSNSMSTLFSSLPSAGKGFFGSTSSTGTNMLSDYYSIKNGSYGRLMKAYYSQNNKSAVDKSSETAKTDKVDKTTKAINSKATVAKNVKSAADSLKTSSDALIDNKLYSKVSTTDKSGNKTEAVDVDKIYSAASDFVNSYNNTIDKAAKSDTSAIKSNVSAMNNYTRVNSKALSNIGITIDSDNKLSIDEDKFKNANMDDVKALFGNTKSYGSQVGSLASSVSAAASYSQFSGYNSYGRYSGFAGSSFFDAV